VERGAQVGDSVPQDLLSSGDLFGRVFLQVEKLPISLAVEVLRGILHFDNRRRVRLHQSKFVPSRQQQASPIELRPRHAPFDRPTKSQRVCRPG
jgi:hypothetical protein